VQIAEDVLERLEARHELVGAGNETPDGLEQVTQPLGRDASLVALVLVGHRACVLEVREQDRSRITHARREGLREGRRRRRVTVLPDVQRLPIRRQRTLEPRSKPLEATVDVALEHRVRILLPCVEVREQPGEARPLSPAEAPALLAKPGEVHLEVTARTRVAREIAKPAPKPLRHVIANVRPKRALPAAQTAKRYPEIVQRLVVGVLGEAFACRRRVGQVPERDQSDDTARGFAEIVDARSHGPKNEPR
jgi:hypothetical protein